MKDHVPNLYEGFILCDVTAVFLLRLQGGNLKLFEGLYH